jgi:hypothetical protein
MMPRDRELAALRKENNFLRKLAAEGGQSNEEKKLLAQENAQLRKRLGIKDGDPQSLVEAYMKSKGITVKDHKTGEVK